MMITKNRKAVAMATMMIAAAVALSACEGLKVEVINPTGTGTEILVPAPTEAPNLPPTDNGGDPTLSATIPDGWQRLSLSALDLALPMNWTDISDQGDMGEGSELWDYLGPWSDVPVIGTGKASFFTAKTAIPAEWTSEDRAHVNDYQTAIPDDAQLISVPGASAAAKRVGTSDGDTQIEIWINVAGNRVFYLALSAPAADSAVLEQIIGTFTIAG